MGNGDIAELRAMHPSWGIASAWSSVASGADKRRLVAIRDNVTVSAWDTASLSIKIREEEQANNWPPG